MEATEVVEVEGVSASSVSTAGVEALALRLLKLIGMVCVLIRPPTAATAPQPFGVPGVVMCVGPRIPFAIFSPCPFCLGKMSLRPLIHIFWSSHPSLIVFILRLLIVHHPPSVA